MIPNRGIWKQAERSQARAPGPPRPTRPPAPGPRTPAQLTWQHTRKMKSVMAVQSTFSLNWICSGQSGPGRELPSEQSEPRRQGRPPQAEQRSGLRSMPCSAHRKARRRHATLRPNVSVRAACLLCTCVRVCSVTSNSLGSHGM